MKICVFNPGVVHAVPRTIAFAKFFHEVHYFDMKGMDSRKLLEKNGIIYYAPFKDGKNTFNSVRLQKMLPHIAPDGIICHFAYGGHFSNSILYNKCPVAVIAMGHDILYAEGDGVVSPLARLLIRMGLRRADYISAKSNRLKERIESYGTKKIIHVNYWGADTSLFKQQDKHECRKYLGLPLNIPIILSPRAVEPLLNIHLIVESFCAIREKYPEARLVVLGRTHKEYRKKIEDFIQGKTIERSIDLVYEVSEDSLIKYYNASDAIVSVAKSDGFPNAVLEAMSCMRPIVVGKILHIEELLKDKYNARLCDITVQGISDSLIDVLDNQEKYKKIAEAGYDTVKQYGDIKVNGERFASVFNEIILRSRGRKRSMLNNLPFWCVFVADFMDRRLFGR